MSYYNQPSSYPGAPSNQQSSYPGGPGFPSSDNYQQGTVGYPNSQYGSPQQSAYPGGPTSSNNYQSQNSSYYNASPSGHGNQSPSPHSTQGNGQQGQEQIQYDEHGNPLPPGERGLGTMGLGAIGGFAANKMTGGHHGSLASAGSGAMLAQGAKFFFDAYKKNKKNDQHHQGGYGGGHNQYGGGSNHQEGNSGVGGLLGAFGKREA